MPVPSPSPDARAVVTGASQGIGEALAAELAARGHHLIVTARRGEVLDGLAARLTERYGVVVEVRAQGGNVELSVTDTGPGIAPEERERIFERFRRIEGTGEYGSGLGLSIVKKIADIHGATIELGAGPDGRGARFIVRFVALAAAA